MHTNNNKPKIINTILFNILIIYCFLSPTSNFFYFFGYVFLLFNLGSFKAILSYNFKLKLILISTIFLSFSLNANSIYTFKDYLIAFNITFLISLFPYFINKEVRLHKVSIIFVTLVIIISQLTFIYDFGFLKVLIHSIYSDESSQFGFDRFINIGRNGGIYYNPNQASKYLTMLLSLFFVVGRNSKIDLYIVLGILFSIFLTGSRTGMFVGLSIIFLKIFIIEKRYMIGFITVFFGLLYTFFGTFSLADNRSFQVNSGSVDYKADALMHYVDQLFVNGSVINFLFGNFTLDYNALITKFNLSNQYAFGFDSEFGILISFFGISFLIILIFFYYKQLALIFKNKYILIFIPFVFWPITSTVLFSFKTSLVFMIILGYAITNVLKRNKKKQNHNFSKLIKK